MTEEEYGSWKGSEEYKREFKKAIARMVVFWVVQTRHSLREELLENNPDREWRKLNLSSAFDNEEEWRAFFSKTARHFRQSVIKVVAESNNIEADEGWVEFIKGCPPNEVIREMAACAMKLVDNKWQLSDPVSSLASAKQEYSKTSD